MKYSRTFTTTFAGENDWRKQRDHFERMVETARRDADKMSEFEAQAISEELDEFRSTQGVKIKAAAIEQYHQALDYFQAQERAVDAARVREIAKWDASRLAPEMRVFSQRISTALESMDNPEAELKEVYSEAKQSGDHYKLRAAADALKQAMTRQMPIERKLRLNSIAKQAQEDLRAIRTTEEISKAQEAARQAFEKAMETRKELITTDAVVSMARSWVNDVGEKEYYHRASTEAARALSRLQETQDGRIVIKPRSE
jgi:hypothetical protein